MYAQKILKRILLSISIIFVLSYAAFRLYDLVSGPKIEIYYPLSGGLVDNVFTITGRVKNADKIYLYDREVFVDGAGNFKENMIAESNYTDIKLRATNRWKKETSKSITVENVNYNKI